mmetsp:Transcript_97938/g.227106  ORF Transcript_97938/g.227106 Transcript_97938/m.227106 type:complete len:359 (-) Transcript_97938:205-1281(-)
MSISEEDTASISTRSTVTRSTRYSTSTQNPLYRHRTARRLLGPRKSEPNLEGIGQNSRDAISVQARVCEMLSRYMSAMLKSFEAAVEAQECLDGIKEVSALTEANLLAGGLLQGIHSGCDKLKDLHEKLQVRLGVHLAAIKTCVSSIEKADRDAAELRWYSQKVEAMTGETESDVEGSPLRGGRRLERNQEKLAHVQHSAAIAELQAKDKVNRCLSRINLDEMTCQVVAATATAFQEAVKDWSQTTDAYNPFDEDLQEEDEINMMVPQEDGPEKQDVVKPHFAMAPKAPEIEVPETIKTPRPIKVFDRAVEEACKQLPSESSEETGVGIGGSQPILEETVQVTVSCWPCVSGKPRPFG